MPAPPAATGSTQKAPGDYTAEEAAAELGVSARWLRHLAQHGQIPHYRHGPDGTRGRITFSAEHLAEIRARAEVRPRPLPTATHIRRTRRHAG